MTRTTFRTTSRSTSLTPGGYLAAMLMACDDQGHTREQACRASLRVWHERRRGFHEASNAS